MGILNGIGAILTSKKITRPWLVQGPFMPPTYPSLLASKKSAYNFFHLHIKNTVTSPKKSAYNFSLTYQKYNYKSVNVAVLLIKTFYVI